MTNELAIKCDICKQALIGTDWKWYQDKGYHTGCLVSEVVCLRTENEKLAEDNAALREEVVALDDWDEDYGK
jgi:cell division protein FtsB